MYYLHLIFFKLTDEGDNGIIYKQLDIDDLAKKIVIGLHNTEGDLRDFVLKKADLEKNMKVWEKIYGDMEIKWIYY